MEIEYNIKNCPFTPFASCELFNSLDDGLSNQKIQWTIGTNFALNKKNLLKFITVIKKSRTMMNQ